MFFFKKEQGQGLVEYALLLSLVGTVVLVLLLSFGPRVGNTFSEVNSTLSTTVNSAEVADTGGDDVGTENEETENTGGEENTGGGEEEENTGGGGGGGFCMPFFPWCW